MPNKDIQTTRQKFASAAPIDFDNLWPEHESNWPAIKDIGLLACMAALFHDFGKANAAFQQKLTSTQPADAYRHEWVSLRLFEAFVRRCGADDRAWLSQLSALPATAGADCLGELFRDGLETRRWLNPFQNLPPLAQIVGWLIVSHHRLPTATFNNSINKRQLSKILSGSNPLGARAVSITVRLKNAGGLITACLSIAAIGVSTLPASRKRCCGVPV